MAKRKPPRQPQQEVQVDLKKADTIKCDDCGNYLFITANVIKRISPILSPTGQEALVPVQVYSCGNCGKVPKIFLEGFTLISVPCSLVDPEALILFFGFPF